MSKIHSTLFVTLAFLVGPASGQSRYLTDNSSAIGASGGYIVQRNVGVGSGVFGVSLFGRLDIAVAYGKGTVEERVYPGTQIARGTITSVTPSITYYVAKATSEQPVNVGLILGHGWVSSTDVRYRHGTYQDGEDTRSFIFGGDVSAVFELSREASLLPGLSFAYSIVPQDGQAVNHVTSPTVGASLGLRITPSPSMIVVVEPGVIYRTQADHGIAAAISGGLVIIPFRPRG